MNKIKDQNKNRFAVVISILVLLSVINLSGCISNQNAEVVDLSKFFGIWTGNLEIQMFGGSNNSTINQLTFNENILAISMTNERGTYIMNYTYKVQGDKLVLQSNFNDIPGPSSRPTFNDSQPFNDTRPPNNGTMPPNGSLPPNGSWPPDNGSRPPNWGQPMDSQRPSMFISFIYSFNEKNDILYLNGSQFIKFQ